MFNCTNSRKGSRLVCEQRCSEYNGVWMEKSNRCLIQLYIDHICYRFAYDYALKYFRFDLPPYAAPSRSDLIS